MGQIAFSPSDRIERLGAFGYTEREAAFLGLAGLHSGYFLRRQYVRFLGKTAGGTAAALIEKALALGHVRTCTYVANAHIYHLCARPFYAALGQEDNRNRRDRQPLTIKNKLMCLDYVLDHPAHAYLPTEQEKIAFFCERLDVPLNALPAKRYRASTGIDATARYFVEKFPIYTDASSFDSEAAPVFSYVDACATTASGFETYLEHYGELFRSVTRFGVVYIAARPFVFHAARRAFDRFCHRTGEEAGAPASLRLALRDYFESRFRYERGERALFDRAALIRLRDQRRQFSDAEIDAQYEGWRGCRERTVPVNSEAPAAAPRGVNATFSTCLLEHNYDVFGTLTGF